LKVSRQALAIRLIDLGMSDESLYQEVIQGLKKENDKVIKKKKSSGAPPPHVRSLYELGSKAASVVLKALDQGSIDSIIASDILNLKPKWFSKLSANIDDLNQRFA
jgi:Zn-dependent peptidase ImmA (M78 family)